MHLRASGLDRAKCCYLTADESQGGVLWPHYHKCDCPHAYDAVSNPNVRSFHSNITSICRLGNRNIVTTFLMC